MQNKRIAFALAAIALSPAAFAIDGTITFTGQINAQTCAPAGAGGGTGAQTGAANFTVVLSAVGRTAFTAVGDVAGRRPFTITLNNCTVAATSSVRTFFESSGPNVDPASGRLNIATGNNNAAGVQIQLLNDQGNVMQLQRVDGDQGSLPVNIGATSIILRYFAQYYATAAAVTPGVVSSSVTYTMSYL